MQSSNKRISYYAGSTSANEHSQHAYASTVDSLDSNCDTEDDNEQVLLELEGLLYDRGIELLLLCFGQQRTVCSECEGGSSHEDCFAVSVKEDGSAMWCCLQ
eukprot:GHRR01018723.1.p2 GENE.GHRR01018723.1~~GHRR01018723.1.p2  ORF type:complete len:102 (+),score=32.37 GHRR01018723.1:107-412(+)